MSQGLIRAALAIVIGVVLGLFNCVPPLSLLEAKLFDLRVYFQSQEPPEERIIAAYTSPEESYQLQQWLASLPTGAVAGIALDTPQLYVTVGPWLARWAAKRRFPVVLSSAFRYPPSVRAHQALPVAYTTHHQDLQQTLAVGFANYPPDEDGVIRQLPIQQRYYQLSGTLAAAPSFVLQAARVLEPHLAMPVGSAYIHYPGPSQVYGLLSLAELQRLPLSELQGKLLVIGDMRTLPPAATPFRSPLSIVELHAFGIASLLKNSYYRHSTGLSLLLPLAAALASYAVLQGVLRWGLLFTGAAMLTLLGSYITWSVFLFRESHLWLDLAAPLLSMTLTTVLLTVYFQRTEGRRRRRLMTTFRRHLPTSKVQALLDKQSDGLQTERRVVTVMFTDIRGFSRMGEQLPPDQVMLMLNEYLTAMTEIIFANQGTLDKYIGDGIMAVYGNIGKNNPKEDAFYAVKTALEMQTVMEQLQKKWMNQGLRPIQIRIGIHTGDAVVGYVGHPDHRELTVIGDTVNTAARIEKLNKQHHTHILMSHSTYDYVKAYVEVHPFGEEKLMGKSSSVRVYEMKGWKSGNTP